jgi:hypothetical protein
MYFTRIKFLIISKKTKPCRIVKKEAKKYA